MSWPNPPETHEPAKVLHVGDVVRVYAQDGRVLEGRIARADQLHRADASPGPWTLFMTPLEDEQNPALG